MDLLTETPLPDKTPLDISAILREVFTFPSYAQSSKNFRDTGPHLLSSLHCAYRNDLPTRTNLAMRWAMASISDTPLSLREIRAMDRDPIIRPHLFTRPLRLRASEYGRHHSKIPTNTKAPEMRTLLNHLPPPPIFKKLATTHPELDPVTNPSYRPRYFYADSDHAAELRGEVEHLNQWPPIIPPETNRLPNNMLMWEAHHEKYLHHYGIEIYAFAIDYATDAIYTQWLSPLTGVAATMALGTRRAKVMNIWEDYARTRNKHHCDPSNPPEPTQSWFEDLLSISDWPDWVQSRGRARLAVADRGQAELVPLVASVAGISAKTVKLRPRTLAPDHFEVPITDAEADLFNMSHNEAYRAAADLLPRNSTPFCIDFNDPDRKLDCPEYREQLEIHPEVRTAMVKTLEELKLNIPVAAIDEFLRQAGQPLLDKLVSEEPLW